MKGVGTAAIAGTGVGGLGYGLITAPLATLGGLGVGMLGDYAVNKTTQSLSGGKYNDWGEFAGDKTGIDSDVMAFTNPGGLVGGGLGARYGKQVITGGTKEIGKKLYPYLMGDKKIPMVGYKPKSNVVGYENPNFPRDFEADDYASFIIDDAGKVQHPSNTRTNQAPQANPINHPIIKKPLPTDKLETWARNYRNNMSPEDINNALVKTYGDKYSYANIERLLNNNQIDENLAYNMLHNSMRKHSNNFKGWITEEQYDLLPKNKSGFTKHAIEKILGNKKLKESIDFEKTLLKPNNKLITHQENTPINSTEMPMETYLDIFNKNLPKLNKIIEKNNKSGIPYTVERLENGTLHFKSELGNTYFGVGVRPGKFKGKVLDVGDERYYQNLPGLNMTNTTNSVFADRIPRSGSAAYKSINEYLKLLKLGRVKPGFNSQTIYSKGLWNDAMLKNKAVGFFKDPNTLVGSMKLIAPIVGGGSLLYNQPNLKNKEEY
jgi:hypothetical protein